MKDLYILDENKIIEVEKDIEELRIYLEVGDDDDMSERGLDRIRNEINFNILKLVILRNHDFMRTNWAKVQNH